MITNADENGYEGEAWALDRELAAHDGVITQSVTLASEAADLSLVGHARPACVGSGTRLPRPFTARGSTALPMARDGG